MTQAESNNTVTITMAIAFQWGQGLSILQYKKIIHFNSYSKIAILLP